VDSYYIEKKITILFNTQKSINLNEMTISSLKENLSSIIVHKKRRLLWSKDKIA